MKYPKEGIVFILKESYEDYGFFRTVVMATALFGIVAVCLPSILLLKE